MKFALVLQRLWQVAKVHKPRVDKVEDATVGFMTLYRLNNEVMIPVHACYTIENGGKSSKEANKDRRIMPGKYELKFTQTRVKLPTQYTNNDNTGRGLLLINPLDPSFTERRIFIHAGNYPQDTEGCILLQSTYDTSENTGSGRGSMRATKVMYDLITKYTNAGDVMPLWIRDESTAFPADIV